ncbi:MAG: FtsQ-type POTRA domain-containing protein [Beijerinckiaceae bacterium]|nr:FtsQ-type POTRA domain-containing protein [Beijerinckiaceae bacterium]
MDGGRRLLRALKEAIASPMPRRAAFAGAADLRHGYDPEPPAPVRARRRRNRELPGQALALFTRKGAGVVMAAAFFGAVFVYGALKGGAYEDFVARNGEIHDVIARAMGFGLDVITISGQREITPAEVLAVAGVGERNSLPFLDVRDVRERIKAAPLVREATVRKLYPDRLVIDITERDAHALWQKDGEIFVISADGTPIDTIHDDRFINLPFVVGEGANARIAEFQKIVEAAGDLKSRIRAGVLVTNRRWNIKLTTGVDVKLPEIGAEAAIAALARLAKEQKIIDKDLISIDMRIPGRLVARLTEEAAAARAEAKKPPGRRGPA